MYCLMLPLNVMLLESQSDSTIRSLASLQTYVRNTALIFEKSMLHETLTFVAVFSPT